MIEPVRGADLSVVVIGRNEAARLRRCFDSVRAMRLLSVELELIYADSRSSDGSRQLAEEAGAKVITVHGDRLTAALGRDAGWRAASAPFVLFIDGDSVIDPSFVSVARPEFDDPKVAVVFGRTREIDLYSSVFSRVYDLEWPQPPPGPAEFCLGTALMRRAALAAVNGHDTTLMAGEEPELCYRLRREGYVVLCLDVPMARHDIAMTSLSQYWRRNLRRGYGDAEVCERFRKEDSPAYKARTRRTRIWGPLLTFSPLAASAGSLALASLLPLAIWLATATGLVVGAARKCRRGASDRGARLLFGIHCYLKEVPLLCGQLRYYFDKYTGKKAWIEYKTPRRAG